MFDDFRSEGRPKQARARLSGSIAAAVLLYGGTSAAIIAATATVRHVAEEELTQVEFAPPPEPEPPPPPPPPVEVAPPPPSNPRPKVKRPELVPPDEVPLEKPEESEAPLAEAGEAGPVDGFLDGTANGTGTVAVVAPPPPPPPPPPPKPEPLIAPVASASNAQPRYSASARRKGIEGVVVVSFEVLESGAVGNVTIVSGPPELHEEVLETVAAWRFTPARRGSTKVRFKITRPIRFRLEDA